MYSDKPKAVYTLYACVYVKTFLDRYHYCKLFICQ